MESIKLASFHLSKRASTWFNPYLSARLLNTDRGGNDANIFYDRF
jgi:hypothetical protein